MLDQVIYVESPKQVLELSKNDYLKLRSLYVLGKDTFMNGADYSTFKSFLQEKLNQNEVPIWLQDDVFELAGMNNNWEQSNDYILDRYFRNNHIDFV